MDLYRSKHSDKKYSNSNSSSNDRPSRSFRNSKDDRSSRYSNDDRSSRYSRDNGREDTTVTCSDCGDQCTVPFVPRSNKPIYCSDCFRKYKPDDSASDRPSRDDRSSRYSNDDRSSRYSNDDRSSRYSRDNGREDTTVTCSDCGDQCTVPFVPRSNKPIYCSDCFRKYKPDDSASDRPSRDDRSSRYSRDNSRSNSGKNDKLLRKQESFYSNGSSKFNESLQKKLYEILGGKICSSCGNNDERSLGICDENGNQLSTDTRRGSKAASWGKYISSPNIAKKELKIFCSNCNDSVKPTSKPQVDRPKNNSKRSKYFPR